MVYNKLITKKSSIIFLIAIFVAINAELINAYTNITYTCQDNICIEGETAIWHVLIYNDGRSEIEFIAIELIDYVNNSPIASLKIPFNPFSDKRGDLIVVRPNEKVSINLTGKLPKANYGQTLIYDPCLTTTITDAYTIAQYNKYESRFCYNLNLTMQVLECVSNNNCDKDEFCSFNKCLKLNCKTCQYIKDHICIDYECCSSEQCKFDEMCTNNTCQKLNCNFNEYVLNHTCNVLNCAFDEVIVNRTCQKLNCSFDEFAFNHTCKKLNCSENKFIQNNACKLLECKEYEYPRNHVCNPLECLYNETILNHTCKPLNCYFFQDVANHSCKNNSSVILKLSLEIIAIIAIIIFFILDFRKYGKKHEEIK